MWSSIESFIKNLFPFFRHWISCNDWSKWSHSWESNCSLYTRFVPNTSEKCSKANCFACSITRIESRLAKFNTTTSVNSAIFSRFFNYFLRFGQRNSTDGWKKCLFRLCWFHFSVIFHSKQTSMDYSQFFCESHCFP